MTEQRPDPAALLAQVKKEEARQRRGKLKVFFGAAAGVGKTYAARLPRRLAQRGG
jgi:two-component system sensor histidine kinase KdpD